MATSAPELVIDGGVSATYIFALNQYKEDLATRQRLLPRYKERICPRPHDLDQADPDSGTAGKHALKCLQAPLGEIDHDPTSDREEVFYYLPPLAAYDDEASANMAWPSWVPIHEIEDGGKRLQNWESMADANQLFDCTSDRLCRVYVRAAETTSLPGGEELERKSVLALCRVHLLSGTASAPFDCTIKAIYLDETYLQAINVWPHFSLEDFRDERRRQNLGLLSDNICCAVMGRMDFNLKIIGPFRTEDLLSAISKGLQQSPLSLQTDILTDAVIGQAGRRPSQLLAPYYEWPYVRVEAVNPLSNWGSANSDGNTVAHASHRWEIQVSTTLLVNRRPTSDAHEWHEPTSSQNDNYVTAIHRRIYESVIAVCQQPNDDGPALLCH